MVAWVDGDSRVDRGFAPGAAVVAAGAAHAPRGRAGCAGSVMRVIRDAEVAGALTMLFALRASGEAREGR